MNILGKRPDQDNLDYDNEYTIPAVLRKSDREFPLGKAIIISIIAHPLFVLLVWLILFLLTILGITFPTFERPQPKVRDIEFVLVNNPEQKPINPNTKNRADRNTRAGGKHNPNKPVSEPEPQAARSTPQKPAAAPRPRMAQRPQQQRQAQQAEPVPPRPSPRQSYPKPRVAPPNAFSIPMPTSKQPRAVSPAGGPVTSAPMSSSGADSSPSPVMGSSSGSPGRGRRSSGYSTGGGNVGNPGPGNPYGRPGIDAIKEPDFGPYMRELQRRIKRNWEPPKGNESKRVVVLFTVSRDGQLLSRRVKRSSGSPEADKAAIAAIELTAPFRPLPPEYRGDSIDIEFTFDYNVYGINSRIY